MANEEATICDSITMGDGMAASAAGGAISRNSALQTAQNEANARNGALSNTINGLDSIYNKTNAPAFNSAVGAVTPSGLQTAQDARVANNVGAIASSKTPFSIAIVSGRNRPEVSEPAALAEAPRAGFVVRVRG